jgi:hypothetical protein
LPSCLGWPSDRRLPGGMHADARKSEQGPSRELSWQTRILRIVSRKEGQCHRQLHTLSRVPQVPRPGRTRNCLALIGRVRRLFQGSCPFLTSAESAFNSLQLDS